METDRPPIEKSSATDVFVHVCVCVLYVCAPSQLASACVGVSMCIGILDIAVCGQE